MRGHGIPATSSTCDPARAVQVALPLCVDVLPLTSTRRGCAHQWVASAWRQPAFWHRDADARKAGVVAAGAVALVPFGRRSSRRRKLGFCTHSRGWQHCRSSGTESALGPTAVSGVRHVQWRDKKGIDTEEFLATFEGREPLVVGRAAPALAAAPRMRQLVSVAENLGNMVRVQHPEAHQRKRDDPLHVRFTIPETGTPILIAAHAVGGNLTYVVSSEDMLDDMDVNGYLSLPDQVSSEDILDEVVPASMRARKRFSLLVAAPAAGSALRRDAVTHSHCILALSGSFQLRMLSSEVTAESVGAFVGDLGCGVAQLDLFSEEFSANRPQVEVWHADVSEGAGVLIPPGWWHQLLSTKDLAVVAEAAYLTEDSAPYILQELRKWLCEPPPKVKEGIVVADPVEELVATCARVVAGRPPDGHIGVGGWPFPLSCLRLGGARIDDARLDVDGFNAVLRRLLERYPAFVFGGVALPSDAPLWRPEELEAFVASRGFLAPQRRFPQGPRRGPPLRLREWLWMPILNAGPSDWRPAGDAPRVIWMYWSQGPGSLRGFRRLCVHSWRVQNPGWQLVILDKRSVLDYVDASELPERYEDLESAQRADALRLALLARYGGVWADVATLCIRPLDEWVWKQVAEGDHPRGLGAFYLACFGAQPGASCEYVENWFLAARRGHPLVIAWRDVHKAGWRDAVSRFDFAQGPLFRDLDLSYISIEEHRTWLTMHICFKKLIDDYPDMRRIWAEEMLLLRADNGAMEWMGDVNASSDEDCARQWVFTKDDAWADRVLTRAPMLKFIGGPAGALQNQPVEHLIGRDNCLARVLAGALPRGPNDSASGAAAVP